MATPRRRSTGARQTGAAERLLAATRSLVSRDGYDAITSRAIAAESGENLAAITYHFGSKDELVAAALIASCRDLVDPVLDVLRAADSPGGRLDSTTVALDELFRSSRPERIAYVEALAAARRWDRVRDELRAMWADVRAVLTGVIERQRHDRSLPEWVDPPALADLFLSTANGILATTAVDPHRTEALAAATQLTNLLLAAGRSTERAAGSTPDAVR